MTPRKPTVLKELAGNPGHRPANHKEAKPARQIPNCPRHLDDEAKKEWNRVVKVLFDAGLFTAVDRPALAAYCSAYSAWVKAEENLQDPKEGWILTSPNGYQYQSVWLSIRNRALDQMKSFLTEFGMTPASRSRIEVKPPEPLDELEQLFANVGKPMMRK